jgi:hypothetical protein
VLALLEDMQHRGEVLEPNLVVCAVEEIGCSDAPLFAQRRGLNLVNWLRPIRRCAHHLHHKGAAVLVVARVGDEESPRFS